MSLHHKEGPECERCEFELAQTHPAVADWFLWVKNLFPTVHISWSFRDREDQNNAYKNGLTRKMWPHSKHNFLDELLDPCSKALDIFELSADGRAKFEEAFYRKIFEATQKENFKIRWGGEFKLLKDFNHFELVDEGD